MKRSVTSRLQGQHWLVCLARLVVIGALTCSVLVASNPCAWMIARSATSDCCKKRGHIAARARCHEQSISSCCAVTPQTVAVVSGVAWSTAGLALQTPIHEWRCFYKANHAAAPDPHPSGYLQHSVLRI
jgi:hypothetical protein